MAVVHPSRMTLVPSDIPKTNHNSEYRNAGATSSLSKHHGERQNRDRSRSRSQDLERHRREHEGPSEHRRRSRGHSNGRDRSHEPHGSHPHNRRQSPETRSSRNTEERSQRDGRGRRSRSREGWETRRRSPDYDDYKRPSERSRDQPPTWKQHQSMYPPRGEGIGRSDMGSSDWLEGRRAQRAQSTLSIWPPSPTEEERRKFLSLSRKSKKRSRRDRSESLSSPDEDKQKKRNEKKEKRRRKDKEKEREKETEREKEREKEKKRGHEHRKEKRKHQHRSRRSDDEESEDDHDRYQKDRQSPERSQHRSHRGNNDDVDRGRSRSENDVGRLKEGDNRDRSKSSSRERSKSGSASTSQSSNDDEDISRRKVSVVDTSLSKPTTLENIEELQTVDDSDDEVGPQPAFKVSTIRKFDEREYGGALLRGEGSAMAAFLQEGGTDNRIPRRGEIGLKSDEIAAFEAVGYVMSGSRHKRMNAVRMRKENQVISAEEKRAILKLQKEEKERREAILREEFKQLVDEKLKGVTTKKVV